MLWRNINQYMFNAGGGIWRVYFISIKKKKQQSLSNNFFYEFENHLLTFYEWKVTLQSVISDNKILNSINNE